MASVIGQVAVPATHQSSQTLARGQAVLRHLEHASDLSSIVCHFENESLGGILLAVNLRTWAVRGCSRWCFKPGRLVGGGNDFGQPNTPSISDGYFKVGGYSPGRFSQYVRHMISVPLRVVLSKEVCTLKHNPEADLQKPFDYLNAKTT